MAMTIMMVMGIAYFVFAFFFMKTLFDPENVLIFFKNHNIVIIFVFINIKMGCHIVHFKFNLF